MIRRTAIGLFGFLAVLWVWGMCNDATVWLTWTDGACALLALGVAKLATVDAPAARAGLPAFGLGAVLVIAALIGWTALDATDWLRWWTLLVGGACVGLGMAAPLRPWLRAWRAVDVLAG